MLTITIVAGESAGRTTDVLEVPFIIGREADCDLRLDDPRVSRHHAQLEVLDDGRVVLRDLGSANGTLVDGVKVEGGTWFDVPGTFRVGRTELRIDDRRDDATVAIAAAVPPAPMSALPSPPPPIEAVASWPSPALGPVADAPVSSASGERPGAVRTAARLLVVSGAIYIFGGGLLLIGVAASRGDLEFVPFGILAIFNLLLGVLQLVLARQISRPSRRIWLIVMGITAGAALLAAWDLVTALSVGLAPWLIFVRLGLALGILGRLWPVQDWYRAR
jgi:hypothetical protein